MNSSRHPDVPTVKVAERKYWTGRDSTSRHSACHSARIAFGVPSCDVCAREPAHSAPVVTVLNNTALGGLGSGSTIGPDGALYVTNGNDGTLIRIEPTNSQRSRST